MAQNPSLQSIRMVVGHDVIRYPWQLAGLKTLEDVILKDAALRDLVHIEYPENTSK